MKKLILFAALFVLVLTPNLVAEEPTVQPTIAQSVAEGKPPADIVAITKTFDILSKEIGFKETLIGVRKANGLTEEGMRVLLGWMDEAERGARTEELRKFHITCMRSLRGCWKEFEKREATNEK